MKIAYLFRKAGALVLIAALLLSCTACGNNSAQTESKDTLAEYMAETGLTQEDLDAAAAAKQQISTEGVGEAAPDASAGSGTYSAADLTSETAINILYSLNNLEAVMSTHNSVTAEIVCYDANNAVQYSKAIQMKKQGDNDYHVRIHLESGLGAGEMEGSSKVGYVACKWDDGSIEVALSAPDEFFDLVQESYLEPYANVQFANVTVADQNGDIAVSADVTYDDSMDVYKTIYVLDSGDLHLKSITEDYYHDQGGTLTKTTMYYDESYEFAACSVLNEVQNAADAVTLHVVYTAPEYGYTNIADYKLSASIHPIVDSQGYVNVFSSADLSKESMLNQITLTGETTLYAVITSFNLMQAQQQAASSFENSTSIMYATGKTEATPEPTAAQAQAAASGEATPNPYTDSVWVDQSPSDAYITAGGTATFVAYATNDTSITWNIISPDETTTVIDTDAANYFGGLRVSGIGTDTLSLMNIPKAMNGWKVQCVFGGFNGPVYTDMATINVSEPSYSSSSSSSSSQSHGTVVPVTGDAATQARTLADNSVSSVSSRISSWGWYTNSVSNYYYNSDAQMATYDIVCSYGSLNATFHFKAYVTMGYAVPVGYDASMTYASGNYDSVGSRTYPSDTDQTTCWAAFGDSIADLTSAVTGEKSSSSPIDDSTPIGAACGSGTLTSNESNLIVLITDWSAVTESASTVRVTVNVSLKCATITTIERPLSMSLNGQTASFYAPGFTYEDNTWHNTQMGSYTFTVSADSSCSLPLEVRWSYNGTYAGVSIGDLVCSGYINIVR